MSLVYTIQKKHNSEARKRLTKRTASDMIISKRNERAWPPHAHP